jgi:hypothetical protein
LRRIITQYFIARISVALEGELKATNSSLYSFYSALLFFEYFFALLSREIYCEQKKKKNQLLPFYSKKQAVCFTATLSSSPYLSETIPGTKYNLLVLSHEHIDLPHTLPRYTTNTYFHLSIYPQRTSCTPYPSLSFLSPSVDTLRPHRYVPSQLLFKSIASSKQPSLLLIASFKLTEMVLLK